MSPCSPTGTAASRSSSVLEILDPGAVPAPLWRPDTAAGPWNTGGTERELGVRERLIAAGPARKA